MSRGVARAEVGWIDGFNEGIDAKNQLLQRHPPPLWTRGEGIGNLNEDFRELCAFMDFRFQSAAGLRFAVRLLPPPLLGWKDLRGYRWSLFASYRTKDGKDHAAWNTDNEVLHSDGSASPVYFEEPIPISWEHRRTMDGFLRVTVWLYKPERTESAASRGASPADAPERDPAARHTQRGDDLMGTGDLSGAVGEFTKALELRPSFVAALHGRAAARQRQGELRGSADDYLRALEIDPKDGEACRGRASALCELGEFDGAVASLTTAIELDPRASDAYRLRGSVKRAKGDADGARADVTRALELDPKDGAAQLALGWLELDAGRWASAVEALKSAIRLSKSGRVRDYASAYGWVARAMLGQREAATLELRTYLSGLSATRRASWSATVGLCLVGEVGADELLSAGDRAKGTDRGVQAGEARYFVGMRSLLDGRKDAAREQLAKCLEVSNVAWPAAASARAALRSLR